MSPDSDFRRPALTALLLFSIVFLAWHSALEFLYGVELLAVIQVALGLYALILLHFVRRRPYSKGLALAFLIPLLSVILSAMAHPATPPNVFVWVFLMPVLSYSLLGRQPGFAICAAAVLFSLVAYLFRHSSAEEPINLLSLSNSLICLCSVWLAMHLYERNRERTTAELRRMATTDELTGLHNRRQLEKVFTRLARTADRQNHELAVIALDLDHFKQINDRWGHQAGDGVLVHVATLLNQQLRGSDWAFRIGGEEFCLFLPMTDRNGAMTAAEALRRQIAEHPFILEEETIPLSASIGVAIYPENGREFGQLLSLADQRMYRAKEQGRNRVIGPDTEERSMSSTGAAAVMLETGDA